MRSFHFFFSVAAFSLLLACHRAEQSSGDAALAEIPIKGSFSNAELIRNPVDPNTEGAVEKAPVLHFPEERINFGEVTEGEVVTVDFYFENTGAGSLLITRAYSTCGCTVPEWPELPLEPGKKGTIHVEFDTRGKAGFQRKPVYIMANTIPSRNTVYLEGKVKSDK